jgi:hypothetical protein
MDMYGVYKIYENGKLIAEQSNKLTVLGRANAIKAMLGLSQSFANSLGIGVGDSVNSTTETYLTRTDLDFSVGQYPLLGQSLGNISGDTDNLVYTARITDTSRYYIKEVGLFSDIINEPATIKDLTIFNFEGGDPLKETVNSVDYYLDDTDTNYTPNACAKFFSTITSTPEFRIGSNSVKLLATSTTTSPSIFYNDNTLDLSYINTYDEIILAAKSSVANKKVIIAFYNGSLTMSASYDLDGTNYSVVSKKLSDFIQTGSGTFDWSNITKITLTGSGTSNLGNGNYIILDGLKVKPYKSVSALDGLVSRAKLVNGIEKQYGSIIDVQYVLTMEMLT